jgi:hypothetical protein
MQVSTHNAHYHCQILIKTRVGTQNSANLPSIKFHKKPHGSFSVANYRKIDIAVQTGTTLQVFITNKPIRYTVFTVLHSQAIRQHNVDMLPATFPCQDKD